MIVMKFGGTSVQDAAAIQRVLQIVQERIPQQPAVVISAMGKTTKHLLETAAFSASGNPGAALSWLEDVRTYHESTASAVVSDWPRTEGKKRIDLYFEEMRKLIEGLSILGEMSSRIQDKMLSYGELISTSILHEVFLHHGIPAVWMDARELVITDDHFTHATPLIAATEEAVLRRLRPEMDKHRIPVLQGYIGSTRNGATTTLGFEGSDFSAALVGSMLGVSEIQIWKDVPGVMTADPEMVPEARTVKSITFEEAAELTFLGAKVLHPKSIDPARSKNIPVYVCNSKTPNLPGSLISKFAQGGQGRVKSIAYKKPLVLIKIKSRQVLPVQDFYTTAIHACSNQNVIPVVFVASHDRMAVAVSSENGLECVTDQLDRIADVDVFSERAAISLVGENIGSGIASSSHVLSTLQGERIDMVSYGSSGNSLTVVLEALSVKRVLNILHSHFFREWDSELFG